MGDLVNRLRELAEQGVPAIGAARELGVSRAVVGQMSSEHRISFLTVGEATAAEVKKLASEGLTKEEIADQIGKSVGYVQQLCRKSHTKVSPTPRKKRDVGDKYQRLAKQVVPLFNKQVPVMEICSRLGSSHASVRMALESHFGMPYGEVLLLRKGIKVGAVFGPLTVLEIRRDRGRLRAFCECKCGWKGFKASHDLRRPNLSRCSNSCGLPPIGLIDRTGEKWGDWEVLGYAGNQFWLCRCACGTVKKVNRNNLTSGRTKRCSSCHRYSRKEVDPDVLGGMLRKGLTKKEIAKEIGVSPTTISRWMVRYGVGSDGKAKKDQATGGRGSD